MFTEREYICTLFGPECIQWTTYVVAIDVNVHNEPQLKVGWQILSSDHIWN